MTTDAEVGARSPTLTLASRGPLFDCRRVLWERLELGFPTKQFGRAILPAKPNAETWKRAFENPPMVGIAWLGLTPAEGSGKVMRCTSDWMLFFAVNNQLPLGLLIGDAYSPEVSMLGLAGLATALFHQWSVPDLGMWEVTSVDNAGLENFSSEEIGIVALTVKCRLSVIDADAAAALPEFLRVGATWNLPLLDVEKTVTDVRQAAG